MIIQGKKALVTGAGSGIGKAIAISLAKRGCDLALVDINPSGLQDTADAINGYGVRSSLHVLDVTDRKAVDALPAEVIATHGGLDILVNNAGIAAGGNFQEVREEVFDRVMEINFHSLVRITRLFLPLLQKSKEARIVNISSIYGVIAPAGQTAYSASKFAVRGFSNALRHELAGTHIGVSVVHPGGVATAIARSAIPPENASPAELQKKVAMMEKFLKMPPEKAGEIIVTGIEKNKARIIVGSDAQALKWMERLFPVNYWSILMLRYKKLAD
jgi:short-subunit dehydrogenase